MTNDSSNIMQYLTGNTTGGEEIVTISASFDFLQQLSLLETDIVRGIELLCIEGFGPEGRMQEENVPEFESGKLYAIDTINPKNAFVFLEAKKHSVSLPLRHVEKKFMIQTVRSREIALRTSITQILAERAEMVNKAAELFLKTEQFQIGDKVIWKKGLKNAVYPFMDEIVVVIEIIDPPVTIRNTSDDMFSNVSGTINDIVIAFINREGHLDHFPMDSRRFKKI